MRTFSRLVLIHSCQYRDVSFLWHQSETVVRACSSLNLVLGSTRDFKLVGSTLDFTLGGSG